MKLEPIGPQKYMQRATKSTEKSDRTRDQSNKGTN